MKYPVIIFDWDGTLMDSIDKIVLCMQAAAKQENQLVPTEQNVKNIVGLSLQIAMEKLFPTSSSAEQSLLVDAYRHQYNQYEHVYTPLYEGITDLLTTLKSQGYTLAVATGKGRHGLNRMLEISHTAHLFSATVCADEASSKPDPLMISLLLDKLNVTSEQAIMIGDSSYDLDMAKNAGIKSIGVSYGVHDALTLKRSGPIAIVDSLPAQLLHYI